jgi:hypothetical protein
VSSYREFFIVVACLVCGLGCRSNAGEVALVNRSGSALTGGELQVSGQRFRIESLKPGGRQVIKFRVSRDSGYEITVTTASGEKLEQTLGYVTPGFDFQDELWIEENDIVLRRSDMR